MISSCSQNEGWDRYRLSFDSSPLSPLSGNYLSKKMTSSSTRSINLETMKDFWLWFQSNLYPSQSFDLFKERTRNYLWNHYLNLRLCRWPGICKGNTLEWKKSNRLCVLHFIVNLWVPPFASIGNFVSTGIAEENRSKLWFNLCTQNKSTQTFEFSDSTGMINIRTSYSQSPSRLIVFPPFCWVNRFWFECFFNKQFVKF